MRGGRPRGGLEEIDELHCDVNGVIGLDEVLFEVDGAIDD